MVSWYNTAKMTKWFEPNEMKYDFYQAAHPWGSWSFISFCSDNFIGGKGHMYGPSLCAKFQAHEGSAVRMSLFTAGCPFEDRPTGLYKVWRIPIVLETSPLPTSSLVKNTDPRIVYKGPWTVPRAPDFFAKNSPGSRTSSPGASAHMNFSGTGVTCLAAKGPGLGGIEIYLDGSSKAWVNLRLDDFPLLSRVTVLRVPGLESGQHSIRIVARGPGAVILNGFEVLGPI
jgi:hypothetical protein